MKYFTFGLAIGISLILSVLAFSEIYAQVEVKPNATSTPVLAFDERDATKLIDLLTITSLKQESMLEENEWNFKYLYGKLGYISDQIKSLHNICAGKVR